MGAPTFSHHVRELCLAGLLEIVRHGKSASLSFRHEIDRTSISVPSLELVFGWFRLQSVRG